MDDGSPLASDAMPEGLAGLVKPELQPGERLIWASRAYLPLLPFRSGPLAKGGFLAIVLLLACLSGLGALKLVSVPGFPGWVPDPNHEVAYLGIALFVVATGLAGIATALLCPLLELSRCAKLQRLRRRIYAPTSERAIIWFDESGSMPISLPRESIPSRYVRSVRYPLGYESVLVRRIDRDPPGFLGVADASLVEELIRRHLLADGLKAHR